MGIMYKLMKHRNLTMDLSKEKPTRNTKSDKCRLITIDGNIIESHNPSVTPATEEDSTKDMETDVDKQFTAEHILQLCKFLAEKSKRNKNLYKQQQSPKKINKSKQQEFHFQQMDYEDNEVVDYYQNEALPLLTNARDEHQTDDDNDEEEQCQQNNLSVLATRLSPDINLLNISTATTTTTTSCALQHHQQQQQQQHHHQQKHHHQQQQNQGKRDILLKIRHQIFERKRLREKGGYEHQHLNGSQVWRPWELGLRVN